MAQPDSPQQARTDNDQARRSGAVATRILVFIHGFLDRATIWQDVIDRLECPGWTSLPVNLHATGLPKSRRRGATLEAYRDQVGDAIDALESSSCRPTVIVGQSMGTQIAELLAVARQLRTVGLVLISPIPLRGYTLSAAEMSEFETAARNRDPAAAAEGREALLVARSPEVVNTLVAVGTSRTQAERPAGCQPAGRSRARPSTGPATDPL